MSKNKKSFFVGIISSALIFLMGILYITIPSYYGVDKMHNINSNDLLLSALLVVSVVKFGEYVLVKRNPNDEPIYITIMSSLIGVVNTMLLLVFPESMALATSLIIFVTAYAAIKLFTIDYYHDHNDAYFYIETMFLIIFAIIGITIAFNLFDDSVLQTIMLGFFFISLGILNALNYGLKCMLKSKRFLKKIKLK